MRKGISTMHLKPTIHLLGRSLIISKGISLITMAQKFFSTEKSAALIEVKYSAKLDNIDIKYIISREDGSVR